MPMFKQANERTVEERALYHLQTTYMEYLRAASRSHETNLQWWADEAYNLRREIRFLVFILTGTFPSRFQSEPQKEEVAA